LRGGSSLGLSQLPIKYYYPVNPDDNLIYLAQSSRNLPDIVGGKKTQKRKVMIVKRFATKHRNVKHNKKYSFKKHLDKMLFKICHQQQ
jgi:hypothetical protein